MTSQINCFKPSSVYNAHVKSFTVARQLIPGSCHLIRVVAQYRNDASRAARSATAKAVRAIRNGDGSFMPPPHFGHITCSC